MKKTTTFLLSIAVLVSSAAVLFLASGYTVEKDMGNFGPGCPAITSMTNSSSSVDSTSKNTLIAPGGGGLLYAEFRNDGDNVAYINFTTATATPRTGIRLATSGPESILKIGCPEINYIGGVTAITKNGTTSLTSLIKQ